jgi:hypothetical protein
MVDYVCVLFMTGHILSNDARWQKCIFTSAAIYRQLVELLLKEIKVRKG